MTEAEMYEKSFQRPKNYFHLSERQQWDIDAKLGILDWFGHGHDGMMTKAEEDRFKAHYKRSK